MQQFGKYLLIRKISSGGMADVYHAKALGIRGFAKTVAIKRIFPHLLDRTRFVRMFTDEAKIAAQLVHPNIVQIYDLGSEAGVPYIAMELVEGRDLFEVLDRLHERGQQLPAGFAVRVAVQLCRGLHHAHELRGADGEPLEIVHRDVSPRNILLGTRGEVKLTDFGVARARDREEHTEHGIIKGKVRYLSPESASGRSIDRRSDLFSLGTVLFEMLTMRPLFDSDSQLDTLLAIRNGEISLERFSLVPEPLRPVLQRALQPDPDLRYETADELGRDLAAAAQDELSPASASRSGRLIQGLFGGELEREREEVRTAEERLRAGWQPAPSDDNGVAAQPTAGAVFAQQRSVRPPLPTPKYEGNLAQLPLARVLHILAEKGAGGQLDLRRDPVVKSVFLESGDPVFVTSNVSSELFGEFLVGRRVISSEQLQRALEQSTISGTRLVETLLAQEVLAPHALYRHLAEQVRERILEMFTWSGGRFAFYEGVAPPDAGIPLGLRSHALIHDGVREQVPLGTIRTSLERARDHIIQLSDEPMPSSLGLSGREQRILRSIAADPCSLAELVRREREEDQVLRLIYLLEQLQRVRFISPMAGASSSGVRPDA
jgi:serine/threonine protein kinase